MATEDMPFRPESADSQPSNDSPSYGSTHKRHPKNAPLRIPQTLTETTGPHFASNCFQSMPDLSILNGRPAMGERIIVRGRVLDEDQRPLPHIMIEIWQANAAGRYAHPNDQHDAPLDPNFHGAGRVFSDGDGWYQFTSIKPGAYPWRNHDNAWRPNHIHYSLFGSGFGQRLITQMYFPGDPLLALDPIFLAVPDPVARDRLVARFDIGTTLPDWALGYRFDFILRGRVATPTEQAQRC
jgi:protocatechuate 3,4-dioxygenase, beta subunit